MKTLLKSAREKKGLLVREVATSLGVDAALVSKFESGARKPTKEQVLKLANILSLDSKVLMLSWLKEKILYEIKDEALASEALLLVQEELSQLKKSKKKIPLGKEISALLNRADTLKKKLEKLRKFDSYRIAQALELEYTFESNRIEGNTLTLKETDLVISAGLTISGKSMREHLEAINHKEAIHLMKLLSERDANIKEADVLDLHRLVLRSIDDNNAGKYRTVQVMIKGSKHMPPAPFLVLKQMEELFYWYDANKESLHPIVLAAEMHERLVTIHPFIDGNGRTSRLLMNLILLSHGYVIANIKGDYNSRMAYYESLEMAQTQKSKDAFIKLVIQYEVEALERYLSVLGA